MCQQESWEQSVANEGGYTNDEWWEWPDLSAAHHDIVLSPSGNVSPRFTLIFFHSCAHGPQDVFYYAPYLWSDRLRPEDLRVVAPCSPRRLSWWGTVQNSWYEYTTDRCWFGEPDQIKFEHFVEQRHRLLQLLEAEHARLPRGGRIILGGLSQGTALALDLMLHAPSHVDSIAGVFCARGMMQEETLWNLPDEHVRNRARSCQVQCFHGKKDNIVPWRLAKKSYAWLEEQGFAFEFHLESGLCHSKESYLEGQRVASFVSKALLGGHGL